MAYMDPRLVEDVLLLLWTSAGTKTLRCITCHITIDPDEDVLARTYSFKSQLSTRAAQYEFSSRISVGELNDELVLFDRHLECLVQSTKFIAISHVWHSMVAMGQSQGPDGEISLAGLGRTVCQAAYSSCRGITAGLVEAVELWHDYVSVPQWQHDQKARIIPAIARIFGNAALVVIYAADLDHSTVLSMRRGSSVYERCRAISNLCHLKWFSRVWTAMEYTQPRYIRFMTKDCVFVAEHTSRDSVTLDLFEEMQLRWREEVARQDSGHALEEMVGMGDNLVPWQLGSLRAIRALKISSQLCTFALAHQIFARRGFTNPRDFFSVLLAILEINSTQQGVLNEDSKKALLEVAHICILRGDLSPIFMVPAWFNGSPDAQNIQSYGYNDIATFGLGELVIQAPSDIARYDVTSKRFLLTAERMGNVHKLAYRDSFKGMMEEFADVARQTMEVVGCSLEGFVYTVGGRLYGQDASSIMRHLSLNGRSTLLSAHLTALHAIWSGSNFRYELKSNDSTIIIAQAHMTDLPRLCQRFEIDLGRVVGRFIWGNRTCDCPKTQEVAISLNEIPLPRPNLFEYGKKDHSGRLTVHLNMNTENIIAS